MKVNYTTADGRMSVTVEGEKQTDVFAQLSAFQEVFTENTCGACGNEDLKFVVRTVEDNNFYEIQCNKAGCRAKLAYGQHKKGGSLFPRRKDDEGNFLGKYGWVKWNPETKKAE